MASADETSTTAITPRKPWTPSNDYEQKCDEAVKDLLSIPEPDRTKYVAETITAVVAGASKMQIRQIFHKGLPVKDIARGVKEVKGFLDELNKKSPEILAAIMFTIQPQFRDFYLDLLDRLTGEPEA